jgi:uroporphyrinogen-III synthase
MATVLLLREPSEASALSFLLEEEGHDVLHWPVLAVSPLAGPSFGALGEQLGRFSWVIPESPTAVRVLAELLRSTGAAASARRAAFVAPSLDTVRALGRHGWEARHVLPERSEARLETLSSLLQDDDEILWVGGPHEAQWRDWLGQVPGRATLVRLYEADRIPAAPEVPTGTVIVVESPTAAEVFAAATEPEWRSGHRVVAGGPLTHAALSELGISVQQVATHPTTEALFDATRSAAREG